MEAFVCREYGEGVSVEQAGAVIRFRFDHLRTSFHASHSEAPEKFKAPNAKPAHRTVGRRAADPTPGRV